MSMQWSSMYLVVDSALTIRSPVAPPRPANHSRALRRLAHSGLATCQNIVRRYGGRICISSNVGRRTTIQIYLPRVDIRQAEQSRCPEPLTMPWGSEIVLHS
jgi:hypothetical protein